MIFEILISIKIKSAKLQISEFEKEMYDSELVGITYGIKLLCKQLRYNLKLI